jgi:hypothetical protein
MGSSELLIILTELRVAPQRYALAGISRRYPIAEFLDRVEIRIGYIPRWDIWNHLQNSLGMYVR